MSAGATGIQFANALAAARGLTNQLLLSGSGVALGDVDGDGRCDIYLCGLDSPNALYRNLGDWKFQDIATNAGVACADQSSTGAVLADVDGDGDLDLLVNGWGRGTRLFMNDGKGRFAEATAPSGLKGGSASLSMALGDIDGDGDLDLYVANYRMNLLQDQPNLEIRVATTNNRPYVSMVGGRPATAADRERFTINPATGSIIENGEADVLYRNDGRGHFTPVSWTDGSFVDESGRPATTPLDWGLSVMFRDMNGDRAPDIYVCNDMESVDRIWVNDGQGRFQAIPRLALRHTCLASMGIDFADINRDGLDDFFVVDMLAPDHRGRQTLLASRAALTPPGRLENRPQYMRNALYLNRGDGTYAELAQLSGLDATDWSWMPLFLDVDLDGYEDVLVTTGIELSFRDADARQRSEAARAGRKLSDHEFFELRKSMPRLDTPNHAYRNRGDLTFENVSAAWGFDSRQIANGMALADLDQDGDLDVVINCLNGPALVYRHDAGAPRVAVRLKGRTPNTGGVGAKIKLLGGPVPQSQEMISGGRYLSGDDAMRVFAAGTAADGLSLEVTWRSGQRSVVSAVQPNRIYEIDEAAATNAPPAAAATKATFFKEVSDLIRHRHHEEDFKDFGLQPLLPKRFSTLGPGVCWSDFNNDGWDDLVIASGRGGELGVFPNNGQGGFGRVEVADLMGRLADDQTTVLCWPWRQGMATLLVGVASYESGVTNYPAAASINVTPDGVHLGPSLPLTESSAGPMAMADVDGDGSLDVFVGGRVTGGRYPEPASSRLYRSEGGKFQVMDEKQFNKVGLVSGVVFSDLDGDGDPDLVLACEWGPLKLFRNDQGRFTPWNIPVSRHASPLASLPSLTGWWNSVTAGDFDGDGRMDLVAGNWGRNTKYQRYLAQPLRVHYGDWEHDGLVKLVEGYFEADLGKVVPWRHWDSLAVGMPFVKARYHGFKAFSEAGVKDILADHLKETTELTVTTLDSMLFLNRGDRFEAVPLPVEAQLSPVFGLCVGDLDGDGHEDVFLSQNFFGVDAETTRCDGGRSVWLKGDGRGQFTAVPGQESGLLIHGEGRGAALCDYDADGRVDLVAAQNGAETKLYHNESARPGLRVRLAATAGNMVGAGAIIRLIDAQKKPGPAREIHLGSGYWSQDSPVQVMAGGVGGPPVQLQVRWPGGKITVADIPKDARDIAVDSDGQVIVLQ